MTEQWDYSSMDLMDRLEAAFPFARRIEVTVPLERDGDFLAELVLPVRHGESRVQLYRYPQGELYPAHERGCAGDTRTSSASVKGGSGVVRSLGRCGVPGDVRELVSETGTATPLLSPAGGPG